MASGKDVCGQCWCVAPWVNYPGCCQCDSTWYKRACGWSKSKKGAWYCPLCWNVSSTEKTVALDAVCLKCRREASSAVSGPPTNPMSMPPTSYMTGSGIRPPTGPIVRERPVHKTEYFDSRAMLGAMGIRAKRNAKSCSSSRSSSSSSRSRRKKKKKKRKKSSSSSSRSSSCVETDEKKTADVPDAQEDDEIAKAKKDALEKLVALQKVESKDARNKEFRSLLRSWHPDKNPDKVELATAVFQFLQKGKKLIAIES